MYSVYGQNEKYLHLRAAVLTVEYRCPGKSVNSYASPIKPFPQRRNLVLSGGLPYARLRTVREIVRRNNHVYANF